MLVTRPDPTRPDPTREISNTCRPDPRVGAMIREETGVLACVQQCILGIVISAALGLDTRANYGGGRSMVDRGL